MNQEVVNVLQVLNLVDLLETVEQGESRNVEHKDAYFNLTVEEADSDRLVVGMVKKCEVDVSEVHHKQVDNILAVLIELSEDFLLIFVGVVSLFLLAHFQFSVKIIWEVLNFLYLCPHSHLNHHQFLFRDCVFLTVTMQQSKTEGHLQALYSITFRAVELIDPKLKVGQLDVCLCKKALRGQLFDLFLFEFFEEELFLDIGEEVIKVV